MDIKLIDIRNATNCGFCNLYDLLCGIKSYNQVLLLCGSVITWSSPATAIGGLLMSLHELHTSSFLQAECNRSNSKVDNIPAALNIFISLSIKVDILPVEFITYKNRCGIAPIILKAASDIISATDNQL